MSRYLPWLAGIVVGLAIAAGAFLVFSDDGDGGDGDRADGGEGTTTTTTYEVPTESMEPSFSVGDRISVDLDAYGGSEPELGDVVVFHPPAGADNGTECGAPHPPTEACAVPTAERSSQLFLRRIVAGPGDTLSIEGGHPVVNGVAKTDEPYAMPCGSAGACDLPKTITVPSGMYFVLGDNRGASDDSRFWGPVPQDWIVGRVESAPAN